MEADVYEQMVRLESTHWWFRGRRTIVASVIESLGLPEQAKILEIGAGTGGNTAMLESFGRVDSIEPDARARELAADVHGAQLMPGALPDALPPSGYLYDLILLTDVLEHIKEDGRSLESLKGLLAPEGRLLLTVPALQSLWSEHDLLHHHFRRYSSSELTRVLEKSGFTVYQQQYMNSLLLPAVALARLCSRIGLRSGGDDKMPGPWVNRLLYTIFSSERYLIRRQLKLPLGVSLLALAGHDSARVDAS
ncbi:class I SAM-dependent methyltransferase [Aestuariirhabdus sp. LZHN29]|uniref:class I SAM-dependent methyltransferase n=1 Tax=Aestuariirhabdus sp. LZHN29 TaxID=3417462 RepID=UPI003CE8FEA5